MWRIGGVKMILREGAVLNKEQVIKQFDNAKDTDLFCFYCYSKLSKLQEGDFACHNMMCLNDETYDKKGIKLEGTFYKGSYNG